MISQNKVSVENIEVQKGDQMRSPKINVVHSQVSSQNAMFSKRKKMMNLGI